MFAQHTRLVTQPKLGTAFLSRHPFRVPSSEPLCSYRTTSACCGFSPSLRQYVGLSTDRGTFQVPLVSTFRLSLSPDGLLQSQVLKSCFILQPHAGLHSRPRISPCAQPYRPRRTALSLRTGSKRRASPRNTKPASRYCSAPRYVLRAWGLARQRAVSFFGFSLFQANPKWRAAGSPACSTHDVAQAGEPTCGHLRRIATILDRNNSRVVTGLRELSSLTVQAVKDREP